MRVQERIAPPTTTQESEEFVPDAPRGETQPPPSPTEGFILNGIVIEGATAIPQEELQQTYKEHIGLLADISTAQFIAGRITQLYRERGFFLTRALVPQQDVENGIVKIVVIEGYVSRVRMDGDALERVHKKDHLGLIEENAEKIKAMKPLSGPALEETLLLFNDFPGVKVHAVLEALPPEEASPGAVGLVVQLNEEPNEFSVTIDNFGSRYNGPVEVTATAAIQNSLIAFDRLSLALLATAELEEAKAISAGYHVPLNANGTSLELRAGYSTLVPGYDLEIFEVESESYNAGIQINQSIVRNRKNNLSLNAGFDLANVSTDFLGNTLYTDRIRALRFGAIFNRTDEWNGVTAGDVKLSQGIDLLGAKETGSVNMSRANGRSDFTKVEGSLSRLQQITDTWQVFGSAHGQYAWGPLLSSEEFGYGGQAFGRAYDPSEITGDSGIAAAIELRYNGLPEWHETIFQPFLFYDIGKVWKDNGPGDEVEMSGASAGFGLKFYTHNSVSGYLATAFPLTATPTAAPGYAHDDGPRFIFQLSMQF